jgi:multiple sugar transport system permease protein
MAVNTLSSPNPVLRRPRIRFNGQTVFLWVALGLLTVILIAPITHMIAMAFTPEQDQLLFPPRYFPLRPTFDNFAHIFADKTLPIARWFFNSVLVATVTTGLILFLSSLSAYAFARLEFPGRDQIFFILLISLMIPGAVTLIPTFLLLRDLSWLDTYNSIWFPGAAGVGAIFFLRQQFYSIPKELEDAAYVDGANRFRVYWQVCLPLVRSALVGWGILAFLGTWNDLFWPLIVLSERWNLTLPVGLLIIAQGSYVQRGLAFAGGFIGAFPPLVVYGIFQRQILSGISTTGLSGR